MIRPTVKIVILMLRMTIDHAHPDWNAHLRVGKLSLSPSTTANGADQVIVHCVPARAQAGPRPALRWLRKISEQGLSKLDKWCGRRFRGRERIFQFLRQSTNDMYWHCYLALTGLPPGVLLLPWHNICFEQPISFGQDHCLSSTSHLMQNPKSQDGSRVRKIFCLAPDVLCLGNEPEYDHHHDRHHIDHHDHHHQP